MNALAKICTCMDAIKEVHYTVKVANRSATATGDRPYFAIESVTATVVKVNVTGVCDS